MKLNILYHHRTQGRGAEGVHITSIVRAFEAMGHTVTVLSPPGVNPLDPAHSIPVDKAGVATSGLQSVWKWISRHLPNALFELAEIAYNVPAYWRLRKIMAAQRFDLIYERYAFYLIVGALLARRHHIPFVLEANEVSGIAHRARKQTFPALCARFERFLFVRCTSIHTVSSHLKQRILNQGVSDSRAHVTPNAFDVEKVKGRARQPTLVDRFQLDGKTVIGFAGWFDHWDRLDFLIDVFCELKSTHLNIRLLLIGDGPVAAQLHQRVDGYGLTSDVVFTGAVPRQEVYDYIALLDIAVLPHSNDFGSPVVMFEFMGMHIPVVAPKLEPILDVQRDGETALLFDPLNRAQCRAAIDQLVRSADLRYCLSANAYAKLVAEHTWCKNTEQILRSAGYSIIKCKTGATGSILKKVPIQKMDAV